MAQINKPSDYFNTVLYTGTGSSQDISVGFQTDWTWIKQRSGAENHNIFDTVRTATKRISSNRSNAEDTQAQQLTAFGSNGFTVGTDAGANLNGGTYASWNWLAGGTASSNTDGSITSTVSANTTSGFSIVKYTGNSTSGATVGHGLGVVPKLMIVKTTARAGNWVMYHHTQGATKYLELNNTGAVGTSTAAWNDTEPTSSVFSLGSWSNTNDNGFGMIAYCFAEKKGFSKFGSYTGNGNSDGAFVYTGFRPAFIMVKDYSTAGNNWFIWDNKRDGYNILNRYLRPNLSDAEGNYDAIDILSNGFKNRNTSGSANGSGTGYIYMAFAESPLVGTNNIPTTAR